MLKVATADSGQAWDPRSLFILHSPQDWKEKYIHENYTKALAGKLVETVRGSHPTLAAVGVHGVELEWGRRGKRGTFQSAAPPPPGNAWDGLASFPSSTFQLRSVDALTRRTELLGMVV